VIYTDVPAVCFIVGCYGVNWLESCQAVFLFSLTDRFVCQVKLVCVLK
jgi:hypothetical protein